MHGKLAVTRVLVLTAPDGTATQEREVWASQQYGYQSVSDLQKQARERWHRPGYASVSTTPQGVRIDYAKPKNVASHAGWRLDLLAEELSLV